MKKCDCWVCSDELVAIRKKLRGKQRAWFDELINRCMHAEEDSYYWKDKYQRERQTPK